jgi:hypothetical protein
MDCPRSLGTFPTEIWDGIPAPLVQELPDYKDIARISQKTIELPASFVASRSSLLHLCHVSKRLDSLTRPFLFKTVVIWEADSLLLLWSSLKSRPNLGHLMHQMACWITLTRETTVQSMMSLAKEKLESSAPGRDLYQTLSGRDDVPQFVLFDILCRSPQLAMLSLLVPRSAEGAECSALMAMVAGIRHSEFACIREELISRGCGSKKILRNISAPKCTGHISTEFC